MVVIRLSTLFGEHKMSQADLARITGIRPNTINDLYHDVAERINLEHLDRICEALGCLLGDLVVRVPGEIKRTGHELILEPHARRKSDE